MAGGVDAIRGHHLLVAAEGIAVWTYLADRAVCQRFGYSGDRAGGHAVGAGWERSAGTAVTLVEQLARFLGWLSALPFAVWQAEVPGLWAIAVALLATLLILAPRGWPLCWLALFGWLPLLLDNGNQPAAGEMWVTALDVGQGMAVLVETPGQKLLYDTGLGYGGKSDAGHRIIVPYLRARGIDALDALIVSHADIDHSGDALSVMAGIDVATVYSSLVATHPIAEAADDHRRCHEGQTWQWGGDAV